VAVAFDVARDGLARTLAGGVSGYAGPLPLYGALDYFPLALAVAYGLLFSLAVDHSRLASRTVLGGMAGGVLVTLLFFRSKGAILTAVLITVAQLGLLALEPARRGEAMALGLAVVGVAVAVVVLASTSITVRNLEDFLFTEAGDESSRARIRNVEHAVGVLGDSPVIGLAYVAAAPDSTGVRIANPHNQYLTYAVRAGIPALVLFAWVLVASVVRLFGACRPGGAPQVRSLARAVLAVLLGVGLVSNLLQDNFTQPYSGCLLWLLLGMAAAIGCGRVRAVGQPGGGATA
jgi:O-antigen ligase